MIASLIARAVASALRGLSIPLLLIGSWATPLLMLSRRCEDAAREWDPRLWDRTHRRTPNDSRD